MVPATMTLGRRKVKENEDLKELIELDFGLIICINIEVTKNIHQRIAIELLGKHLPYFESHGV